MTHKPTLSLDAFAGAKLKGLEAANRRRELTSAARGPAMALTAGGRDMISFTDNDYLGLSTHPAVVDAAIEATKRYGAGSGASRLVTGNHPLYAELEAKIAAFKGMEAAIVFGSGYLANSGIIPALVGKSDLILADELIHTSIHAGLKLSGATVRFFRHNDVAHAAEIIAAERGQFDRALMVVDGVYSMDGDIAPLKALGELCADHDTWLMSDDAHGLGTIGGGRGAVAAMGAEGLVPLQMGTLSKAIGGYGGYLAASRVVIDLMKTRARSLVYTTGLPPGTVAAAVKALELIETNADMVARPVMLARHFAEALGLPAPETPIVPLVIGAEADAMAASAALAEAGYKVTAFRPPTVPEGTSRLRFCFSASHRDEDVTGLIAAVRALGLSALGKAAE